MLREHFLAERLHLRCPECDRYLSNTHVQNLTLAVRLVSEHGDFFRNVDMDDLLCKRCLEKETGS